VRHCWGECPWWRRCRTTSTVTGCRGLKQLTWPRTEHSEGCWQLVRLCTCSVVGWRQQQRAMGTQHPQKPTIRCSLLTLAVTVEGSLKLPVKFVLLSTLSVCLHLVGNIGSRDLYRHLFLYIVAAWNLNCLSACRELTDVGLWCRWRWGGSDGAWGTCCRESSPASDAGVVASLLHHRSTAASASTASGSGLHGDTAGLWSVNRWKHHCWRRRHGFTDGDSHLRRSV